MACRGTALRPLGSSCGGEQEVLTAVSLVRRLFMYLLTVDFKELSRNLTGVTEETT
jgi:hypothetical protein